MQYIFDFLVKFMASDDMFSAEAGEKETGGETSPLQVNIKVTIKSVGANCVRPRAIRESPLQTEHQTPHKSVGVVRPYLLRKLTTLGRSMNAPTSLIITFILACSQEYFSAIFSLFSNLFYVVSRM